MSNSVEIAAVTATLRNFIETNIQSTVDLGDTQVTVQHPGTARELLTSNQVNVFLYQVLSGALTATPPLTLQLCYLITAYGRSDDQILEQRLLARVISILHDNPVLTVNENNVNENQPAQLRIAWQPMPIEALSNLWIAFQTPYRVSATYQIRTAT